MTNLRGMLEARNGSVTLFISQSMQTTLDRSSPCFPSTCSNAYPGAMEVHVAANLDSIESYPANGKVSDKRKLVN